MGKVKAHHALCKGISTPINKELGTNIQCWFRCPKRTALHAIDSGCSIVTLLPYVNWKTKLRLTLITCQSRSPYWTCSRTDRRRKPHVQQLKKKSGSDRLYRIYRFNPPSTMYKGEKSIRSVMKKTKLRRLPSKNLLRKCADQQLMQMRQNVLQPIHRADIIIGTGPGQHRRASDISLRSSVCQWVHWLLRAYEKRERILIF